MPEAIEHVLLYPEQSETTLQRYITKDERDSIPESDFAWPEEHKYPIRNQDELDSAAKLIGRAPEDQQDAIKARAKKIAERKGLSLPDSWKDESDSKQDRATSADGELMVTPASSDYQSLYMPITFMSRRDASEWIVEGQATAEVPDSYGTIFTYDASKDAFQRWYNKYANVREMHDKKAVAKGFGLNFDDANRRVMVRTRVSKAAIDTWIKLQEGILNGFSVGATNVKMGRMEYQGKMYPAITRYDLAELSYVDSPSTPGCDVQILMRADGFVSDVIDISEPEPEQPPALPEPVVAKPVTLHRAGARLSADTQTGLHAARNGAMQNAMTLMALCNCEECQAACTALDPDGDGDIDFQSLNDTDNDAGQMTDDDMAERMQRSLERSLAPVYQRQQHFLARLASFDTNYTSILERLTKLDEIATTLERVASTSVLDEVRAEVSAVKGLAEQIAAQPAPGGPVLHGAGRPYDKTNPYQPAPNGPDRQQIERETLERLRASGALKSLDDQVAAAGMLLKAVPMQGMR